MSRAAYMREYRARKREPLPDGGVVVLNGDTYAVMQAGLAELATLRSGDLPFNHEWEEGDEDDGLCNHRCGVHITDHHVKPRQAVSERFNTRPFTPVPKGGKR